MGNNLVFGSYGTQGPIRETEIARRRQSNLESHGAMPGDTRSGQLAGVRAERPDVRIARILTGVDRLPVYEITLTRATRSYPPP